jgi:hypothetical protein
MSTRMNINDILFMYLNFAEIAKKYRETKGGMRLECGLEILNLLY